MSGLRGWQKIGVVLSILWIFGSATHEHNEARVNAESFASVAYKTCASRTDATADAGLSECQQEKARHIAEFMEGDARNAALFALVPLPFAWIFVYVFGTVFRAFAIGFPIVVPWGSLSRSRKAFVVGAALVSVGAGLFTAIVLLNFYTDSLVPVSPGGSKMVFELDENTVMATGTWTRSGSLGDGSKLADPIQTSKITCLQSEHRCIESRAEVTSTGKVLLVDQLDYDIDSWTPATIIFSYETPCARETYTIDRITQTVNGVGTRIKSAIKACDISGPDVEATWEYHLEDGFKTYWDIRQRARPASLRIIQAFFGN